MHGPFAGMFGFGPVGAALGAGIALFVVVVVVWELFWKGLALWHAARSGQWIWFIVFLLVHTAGILEIVYLIWFRANRDTAPLFPFVPAQRSAAAPITVVEETIIITDSSSDSSSAA